MKNFNKQLLIILSMDVIFAFLIGATGTIFGYDLMMNSLLVSRYAITGPYGKDSWKVMGLGWQYWLDHNRNVALYSEMLIKDHIKFIYPPNTLLLFKYLIQFQLDPSVFFAAMARLFLMVTIVIVAAVAYRSLKMFKKTSPSFLDKTFFFVLISLLTLAYYPVAEAFSLGQSQAWLNALFAVALLSYMTDRKLLAGIIIGFMASFKPQYGLFILWGVFRENWKFSAAILFSGAICVIAGLPEFGLSTYFDYLKGLSFLSQHGEAFMANQSVNGLLNRILSVRYPENFNNTRWLALYYPPYYRWVYFGTLISSFIFIALSLFGGKKNGYLSYADFCLMGLGVTMASPIAWEHHYGILLPIFALLWPLFWFSNTKFNSKFYQTIFILLYLVSGNLFPLLAELAPTYWNILQSLLLFAAIGLFFLILKIRHSGNIDIINNSTVHG